MIIKFEVKGIPNSSWQLFDDVDSLMYDKLGPHSVDIEDIGKVIDFTDTLSMENGDMGGNPGRVLLTFMNSKQLAASQVCAFSPIYLMNNQGRTIEII